ncbi:NUDIX hydrolase [Planktotalea arctica]|uniref:NUDIX hydrolase n=2 Tax=Planktotalea arctica TaxID=1481893 RepID=UPI001FE6241E|nr:NUDIX hydrolase [Planktotalea arctica]
MHKSKPKLQKNTSANHIAKSMKEQRSHSKPFAPIDMQGAKKTGLRTQFAALCYRMRKGKPEILLVTSRRTRRWIIPKGWPQDGMRPAQSAAIEALEEAGVEGKTNDVTLGSFSYTKQHISGRALPCVALVYPLKVKTVHERYREVKQRKRKWFSPAQAARKVSAPELAHIIRSFDPGNPT